jgi:hypothetical protein
MIRSRLLAPLSLLVLLRSAAAGAAEPASAAAALDLGEGRAPRVALGGDGTVAVVYARDDALFIRVAKRGALAFSPEVRVAEVPGLMAGRRRGPQVAIAASGMAVTAIGRSADLRAWTSRDDGTTWSGPVPVTDAPSAAREGLHGFVSGVGDAMHAVWLDLRSGSTEIYASRSTDAGRTWGANVRLYRSPDGHTCECCAPSVAADEKGAVAVLWRNWVAGARDMYLSVSSDGGRTFGPAGKLGGGTWPLDGCPMDGGGVAAGPRGIRTLWRRAETVFAAAPGEAEEERGRGSQPVVAAVPGGFFEAWQTGDGVMVRGPEGRQTSVPGASFPALAASSGGPGPVVLVWEDSKGRVGAARLDNAPRAAVTFPPFTGREKRRP